MNAVDARLNEMDITLPEAAAPVANYVPFVQSGALVYISGQIARHADGSLFTGKLGNEVSLESGKEAARSCGLYLIAQMKAACGGDLTRVKRIVKLGGFVNATPDFVDIPQVINGCSDLMGAVFGEAGKHARSAVACPTLPLGVAVEIDAIVELA